MRITHYNVDNYPIVLIDDRNRVNRGTEMSKVEISAALEWIPYAYKHEYSSINVTVKDTTIMVKVVVDGAAAISGGVDSKVIDSHVNPDSTQMYYQRFALPFAQFYGVKGSLFVEYNFVPYKMEIISSSVIKIPESLIQKGDE